MKIGPFEVFDCRESTGCIHSSVFFDDEDTGYCITVSINEDGKPYIEITNDMYKTLYKECLIKELK